MATPNLNTDLALITTNNAGNITLPLSTSIPGRVITFKDVLGTFGSKTLTLNTTGGDTFEDGGVSKVLSESYGYIQLVGSSGKWYILNGTQVNTIQVSSMTVLNISSFNISTASIGLSSLSFIDNRRSTNSLNVVSTFLTYNNFIISGTKVGYSGNLNRTSFSVYAIPGLAGWYDAADSTSFVFGTGSNISRWSDKSGFGNHAIQTSAGNQPQYNSVSSNIFFNGTSQYMLIPSFSIRQFNPINCFAVINTPTISGNYFNNILRKGATSIPYGFEYYFRVLIQSGVPTVDAQIGYFNGTGSGQFTNTSYTFNTLQLIGMFTNQTTGFLMTNGTLGSPFFTLVSAQQFSASVTGVGFRPTANDGSSGAEYYNGTMNEIIVLNQLPTTAIRQQIEGYLAWKWGLQANLPVSHPYYSNPP